MLEVLLLHSLPVTYSIHKGVCYGPYGHQEPKEYDDELVNRTKNLTRLILQKPSALIEASI